MDFDSNFDNDGSSEFYANPKKYPFLYTLDLDQDVINRLATHLDRIRIGNDEVFVTPLAKALLPHVVLSEWDKIFQSNESKMNSVLLELESTQRSKFGPRSIAKPWSERKQGVKEYYSFDKYSVNHKLILPSNHSSNASLRPLAYDKAMTFLKNSTNSGLPYYTRKGKVKDRTLERIDYLLEQEYPCILFTRSQESGKTRDVWGYPMSDTLDEMRYYRPLLSHQNKLRWRSALLGPTEVDRQVSDMLIRAYHSNLSLVSLDFSSYDKTVNYDLQKAAFRYIKSLFQDEYRAGIDVIFNRFNTIGLVTPDGITSGSHGVPSGSTFTNEVDSIVQYLLALSSNTCRVENMQIQGDDGAYCLEESNVSILYDSFTKAGLNVNVDKSYVAKDYLIYLQRLHHIDYMSKDGLIGGIYPIYRALNRLLYQERWSSFEDFDLQGKDYYSIRTITILENCKHHPLFREFVEFIFKLDKYSLEYSQKALAKYEEMINQGSGTGGLLINQYGDEVRGLQNFETVKLIRSMRMR
ncbi:RNA-dependent RNA polymerase [viral metagenome]|uniref:RNA-dependent RNA polymerase n=1 Tax=viral metagenome TaxID=1070528 RepID=A0A6L2ZJI4_9ZZZZ